MQALAQMRPILPPAPRRRTRRVQPQRQPNAERFAYSQTILGILAQAKGLLDGVLVPELPGLVVKAGLVHDAAVRASTYADEVARALETVSNRLFAAFTNSRLRATAQGVAERTSKTQKSELARQLSTIYGREIAIDVFAEKGIAARLEVFAATNAQLVKNVPQRFYDEVGQRVVQGLRTGQRAEDLQAVIADRYDVSQSRARLIARDQIGKIYGELNKARQQDLGINGFTWRTAGDERVRDEHAVLDGQSFSWDAPPSEGIPGEPINCFPGEQRLSFAPGVLKLYRRRYSGELTELVTDTGEVLRATPNHPVLSGRGWVPGHALNVGDYVFEASAQSLDVAVADPQRADPTFEEFFRAVAPLGVAHRRSGAASWFHGDATDQEVDVVDVDWSLGDKLNASLSQAFCYDALTLADDPGLSLGAAYKLFDGSALAPDRAVRGFCKAHTLFGAGGRQTGDHRGAAIAWLDAVANKARADGRTSNAVLLRKLFHAQSGEIQTRHFLSRVLLGVLGRAVVAISSLHTSFAQPLAEQVATDVQDRRRLGDGSTVGNEPRRIVEKRVGNLQSGHVYNLQTTTGWYAAQSLIVHNCRCTAEPNVQDEIDAL